MSLKDKSKESRKLADDLVKCKKYNLAANRFYYSIYQKTLHYAEQSHGYSYKKLPKNKQVGSHKALINHISDKLSEYRRNNMRDPNIHKLQDIRAVFNQIKSYRETADYEVQDITHQEISVVKNKIKEYDHKFSMLKSKV